MERAFVGQEQGSQPAARRRDASVGSRRATIRIEIGMAYFQRQA
jgi:hypothetical protein